MLVDDRADETPGWSAEMPSGSGHVGRSSSGSLIVAWQDPSTRLISAVGLLEHGPDVGYRFRYLRRAADLARFQPFLSFPDLRKTYVSDRLFALFSQRVMSSRRPDFPLFLRQLHLDRDASPWEQLARSEGRRTGDTIQVFPVPAVDEFGVSVCRFLVHGMRHVVGADRPDVAPGDALSVRDDPENPVNPAAVMVCDATGRPLGFVPDLLLDHLTVLREAGPVSVVVEHVNGPDAPMHLRLLVRLDGTAPRGYQPMSGPGWLTFDDVPHVEQQSA